MAVKVLIVDDSSFYRKRLRDIIATDPRLQVVATAANGEEALQQVSLTKPDVITMDLEMPIMDGITAVKKIQSSRPTPILMLSTWTTAGAQSTLEALEAGATDFIAKRFENLSAEQSEPQHQLCQRIYQLATGFQPSAATLKPMTVKPPVVKTDDLPFKPALIVIGASTGGPLALPQVLKSLSADFPYPIVVVQHMPATFTPSFAARLNEQCTLHVKQVSHGEALLPGHVYIAPGGEQLLIKGRAHRLYASVEESEPNANYQPCIDLTLASVTKACGERTLVIILTGMGSDGRIGCEQIKQQGGKIWAQDQVSSTIYGMPSAVAKAGITDKILNLSLFSQHLMELR